MFPRFTQSGPFAAFLETIEVEENDETEPRLVCLECGEVLCMVENEDTLGVLVRTALAHDTECAARNSESLSNMPVTT